MRVFTGTGQVGYDLVDTSKKGSKRARKKGISYAEAVKNFIKPRPWEELGGEYGVELHEISNCLQVDFHNFKKNLERSDFFEMANILKLKIRSIDRFNKNNVLVKSYVVDEEAAELLLAKSKSILGYHYLRFLRQCRLAAKELAKEYQTLSIEYKKQKTELKQANDKIQALTEPKKRRKGSKLVKVITKIHEEKDLFGNTTCYKEVEHKTISEMSPVEHKLYKLQHGAKVMNGIATDMKQIMSDCNSDHGTEELAKVTQNLSNIMTRPDLPEKSTGTQLSVFGDSDNRLVQ